MQASTLPKSDAYPRQSPPLMPNGAALAGQAILLPFLAELSQADTRNSAARREAEQEAEYEAESDETIGLMGATSTMHQSIEKGERLMSASSRAFRSRQTRAELGEHAATLRNTQQRALAKQAEKSDTPVSTARRSGPSRPTSRGELESTSDAPRSVMRREQFDRPSTRRSLVAQRRGSSPDVMRTDAKAPSVATRVAAQSQAPVQIVGRSTVNQPADSAVKPAASARATAVEPGRAPLPVSPANGRPSMARTGLETAEQQGSKREPALAKARASRATTANPQDPSKNDVNMKQLLRVIRSRISGPRSHMTMRLEPASLGSIRITMDLNDREMQLRIETESHLAQRLLSGKADVLRDALESSGITLERFEVKPLTPGPNTQDAGQHEDVDQQSSGNGSTRANAERSPDERESESPPSPATMDASHEDETERTTESSLNVLA